jgi:hypothetical protein
MGPLPRSSARRCITASWSGSQGSAAYKYVTRVTAHYGELPLGSSNIKKVQFRSDIRI